MEFYLAFAMEFTLALTVYDNSNGSIFALTKDLCYKYGSEYTLEGTIEGVTDIIQYDNGCIRYIDGQLYVSGPGYPCSISPPLKVCGNYLYANNTSSNTIGVFDLSNIGKGAPLAQIPYDRLTMFTPTLNSLVVVTQYGGGDYKVKTYTAEKSFNDGTDILDTMDNFYCLSYLPLSNKVVIVWSREQLLDMGGNYLNKLHIDFCNILDDGTLAMDDCAEYEFEHGTYGTPIGIVELTNCTVLVMDDGDIYVFDEYDQPIEP